MLVVKEPALWADLFTASNFKTVGVPDPKEPETTHEAPITDFDTFVLFAPVSLVSGQPVIWFPRGATMEAVQASTLVETLDKWTLSYLVIETIAGPSAPLQPGLALESAQPRSLQATTQLAAKLARDLSITVVAVCHLSSFVEAARPPEGSESSFSPSFSGQLLRQLADPSVTVYGAVRKARRLVEGGLNRQNSLDVGLPIVCRPEFLASRATSVVGGPGVTRLEQPKDQ